MTDINSQSAKAFYREVRSFTERTRPWQVAVFHEVSPDEIHDITLVSQRVYGRRDEYLAVMAAAGIDNVGQSLQIGTVLVLPNDAQLQAIKRLVGFESMAEYRETGGVPEWIED